MARTSRKIDMNIRIRRCNGNRDCWAAVCGDHDWLMATSYSLDALVKIIRQRHARLLDEYQIETIPLDPS